MPRRVPFLGLALATALLAACSGEDPGPTDAATSDPTDAATSTPTDETSPAEPAGVVVDRPTYRFELPEGWKDTTEDHVVFSDGTMYADLDEGRPGENSMYIQHLPDASWDSLGEAAPSFFDDERDYVEGTRRRPNTTLFGEPALHAVGPGSLGESYRQAFYLIHGADAYAITVQASGKRLADTRELLDAVTATWEWK